MFGKWIRYGAAATVGCMVLGGLFFGKDLASYLGTSAREIQSAAKSKVPVEFELERARDMMDQIIPEMHANIRLVAQEEIEIQNLKEDITHTADSIAQQKSRMQRIRGMMDAQQSTYVIGRHAYTHTELTDELARQFDHLKEAELILASKNRLLAARQQSLDSAMDTLRKTRSQKALLEDQIDTLASQHRLIQASAVGSKLELDSSKLAQTQKLIGEIRNRLQVAERVLAHEGRFTEPIPVGESINESELLAEVDAYLTDSTELASADDVVVPPLRNESVN